VRAILVGFIIGVASTAAAQGLPTEPISVGGGRVVIGGEFAATIAPEDPGFFDYTDYKYSALRNLRLALTAQVRATDRLQFLAAVRMDRGEPFEPYGVYARLRPWLSRRIDIHVGRIPPTFGAFGRGGYSSSNMLIGYPLAYQYLTSLRRDALPRTTEDLWRMRGRGWRADYPLGSQEPGPGLPVVSAFRWDTGVQVHGVSRALEWTGAVTTGSLSNPRLGDLNNGRQLAGRMVVHLTPAVALGVSAASGAFMDHSVESALTPGAHANDAVQRGLGVDGEYSAGHFIGRAEAIWSRWTIPAPFNGGALQAASVLAEGRYRLMPGVHLAVRAEHLGFNSLTSGARRLEWDAPVTRYEAGAGWSVLRNVMVKGSWQRNRRDAGRVRHDTMGAAQVVYWF